MFTKTLSDNAQKSLAVLGKDILPKGTYMAGGSALALHFGHRISVDFNFLGIEIADPKDIGAMKIAAVMTRGTKKEFL